MGAKAMNSPWIDVAISFFCAVSGFLAGYSICH